MSHTVWPLYIDRTQNSGTNDCSENAICSDTVQSFTCACKSGFIEANSANPGRTCYANKPNCQIIKVSRFENEAICTAVPQKMVWTAHNLPDTNAYDCVELVSNSNLFWEYPCSISSGWEMQNWASLQLSRLTSTYGLKANTNQKQWENLKEKILFIFFMMLDMIWAQNCCFILTNW